MIELTAIFIAAIVGWNVGAIGKREIQGLALVVAGWTAVDTVAMVPYLSLEFFAADLVSHAAVVCIPYAVAVGLRRLKMRWR
jgi:hypothetical protein